MANKRDYDTFSPMVPQGGAVLMVRKVYVLDATQLNQYRAALNIPPSPLPLDRLGVSRLISNPKGPRPIKRIDIVIARPPVQTTDDADSTTAQPVQPPVAAMPRRLHNIYGTCPLHRVRQYKQNFAEQFKCIDCNSYEVEAPCKINNCPCQGNGVLYQLEGESDMITRLHVCNGHSFGTVVNLHRNKECIRRVQEMVSKHGPGIQKVKEEVL